MTTYYLYEDGNMVGTSNVDPAAKAAPTPRSPGFYERRGDVVGAYLARRAMADRARASFSSYHDQESLREVDSWEDDRNKLPGSSEQDYWSEGNDDSQKNAPTSSPNHPSTFGYAGFASQSGQHFPYPDPELIRHQFTLYSLLPYIQPERKLNAFDGIRMDIVEQDTGVVLADDIPKKLLVLFLGRKVVNKFIETIRRVDNINWKGPPTRQMLFVPRGHASRVSMRILVAWMLRACQRGTMGSMQPIRIPNNLFAACTLAQTMELFELRRDAYRIDLYVAKNHLVRPIFPVELETLWNCLGDTSKYCYAAIKAIGNRLRGVEAGLEARTPWAEETVALLERHPRLKARVYDAELNEAYQPSFGTQWMYSERD
ncbi:hypothetical protein NX059_001694 [Plenodomus lindquistii]|nr:hypothetical protein NX059_001694 [Plenodomus lindquistii]